MKKTVFIIFAIAALMLLVLNCAAAEHADPKTGLHYEVHTDQDTGEEYACILSCKAEKDVLIPAEIDGLPVREIDGDFVWRSKGLAEKLTTLTIEGAVRVIPPNAFEQCKSLTTVKLPEGLEEIGASAFGDIMTLTSISFPSTLKKIGYRAFGWCRFSEAILPDTLTVIGEQAFSCVPLVSLRLSENLKSIGKWAFQYNRLQTLYIPASVKTVGSEAFAASNNLQKVIIAGEDTVFEPDAFKDDEHKGLSFEIVCAAGSNADTVFSSWKNKSYNLEETLEQLASGIGQAYREGEWECIGLEDGTGMIVNFPREKTKLEFPAEIAGVRITVIGDNGTVNAEGYEKVTSVVIPEGVTEIGKRAFYRFKELSSVKLPGTLKVIGEEAFNLCKLKTVQFPDSLEVIGNGAFKNNKISRLKLPPQVRSVGKEAFEGNDIASLELPDSLEEIGSSAFLYFKGSTLVIPASVKKIGPYAFGPNGSPKAWTVTFLGTDTEIQWNAFGNEANAFYCSEVSFSIPKVTVNCLPGSTADRFFRYDAVKKYQKWSGDQILTAPAERVLSASFLPADRVFYEIIVPEGVEEIADGTFSGVNTLVKITLPASLKRIGSDAFADCPLTEISIPAGVETIGDGAFRNCINLEKVSFAAKALLTAVGKEAFQECSQLKKITLPKSLTEIGESAFMKSGLTDVSIPAAVGKIGPGAFRECEALTRVALPAGLTEIPDYLCEFCRELKSVNIPAATTRIGTAAFRRCRLLTGVTFPEGLTEIADSAFEQFSGGAEMGYAYTNGRETYTRQKTLKLPSTLKKIGEAAFVAWDAVTTVTFAPGCAIEEIPKDAFGLCTHLKSIQLPDTVRAIGENAFRECFMLTKADLGAGVESIGANAFMNSDSLKDLKVPDTLKTIEAGILDGHGENLRVTCGEGSGMEKYLQENYPDVKIAYPGK